MKENLIKNKCKIKRFKLLFIAVFIMLLFTALDYRAEASVKLAGITQFAEQLDIDTQQKSMLEDSLLNPNDLNTAESVTEQSNKSILQDDGILDESPSQAYDDTPKYNYVKCKGYDKPIDSNKLPKGIFLPQLLNQGVDVISARDLSVSCKVVSINSVQINTEKGSKVCPLYTRLPSGARARCATAQIIDDPVRNKFEIICSMHLKRKCAQVASLGDSSLSDGDDAKIENASFIPQDAEQKTETVNIPEGPSKQLDQDPYQLKPTAQPNDPYSEFAKTTNERAMQDVTKHNNGYLTRNNNINQTTGSSLIKTPTDLRDPLQRHQMEMEQIYNEIYNQQKDFNSKNRHPAGFQVGGLYIVPIVMNNPNLDKEAPKNASGSQNKDTQANPAIINKIKEKVTKIFADNEHSFALINIKNSKKPSEFDLYLNLKTFDDEMLKNISYLEKETAIYVAEQAMEKAKYAAALKKANTACENTNASRCILDRIKVAETTQFEVYKTEIEKSSLSEATKKYLIKLYLNGQDKIKNITTPLERYLQDSKKEARSQSTASKEIKGDKQDADKEKNIWNKFKSFLKSIF